MSFGATDGVVTYSASSLTTQSISSGESSTVLV